ncbi:hypothetical protein [Canibacter oris]|uniref:Uncharacterized protein n=1 Tax=Canibacter oris TaxID=1365628 RepID=A0A840DRA4_9MICO|nr:hypothetical protein [Canibacter oris]MBB4072039.1 hypothetical protein [Canibacter oris]
MSYLTISEMSCDPWLIERIAACAASLRVPDPRAWAANNALYLVSDPAWAEKYREWTPPPAAVTTADSSDTAADTADHQPHYTAGLDEDLITDEMIKTAVQNLLNPVPHEIIIEE